MKKGLPYLTKGIFLMLLLLLITVPAKAATYESLTYTITDEQVTITDCDTTVSGVVVIPDTIEGYPVTGIGYDAFYNCASMTGVTIPESVTTIGEYAFQKCSSLTGITLPEGVTSIARNTFADCTNLTSVSIPQSVTSIEYGAFRNCASLTGVTVPSTVTSIGLYVFEGCSSLSGVITIPEGITEIGTSLFSGCAKLEGVVIPESVTAIGDFAFDGCAGLREIHIPGSVTSLGRGAFRGCASLTDVTLPKEITTINLYLFENCTGLVNITIPDSVTQIFANAFPGCTSLATITIPGNVTSIGNYAFNGCTGLNSVIIEEGVTEIGSYAFQNCTSLTQISVPGSITGIGASAFAGCDQLPCSEYNGGKYLGNNSNPYNVLISIPSGITVYRMHPDTKVFLSTTFQGSSLYSVTIADGVTAIPKEAFYSCENLTSVVMPDGITSIGESAFFECKKLKGVRLPENVTTIGNNAFSDTAIQSVVFPASVTSIGDSAFGHCLSLSSIVFLGDAPTIHANAFYIYNWEKEWYYPHIEARYHYGANGWSSSMEQDYGSDISWYSDFDRSGVWDEDWTADGGSDPVDWIYEVSNGEATITGFYDGYNILGDVTIPEKIDGYPVTAIGRDAFYSGGNVGIVSVSIPDSVTRIEDGAFRHCPNLQSVNIPANVTSIGSGVFANCHNLDHVTIPDGITVIGDDMFSNCLVLNDLTIPEGITSIGAYAFAQCVSLDDFPIQETVTSIKDAAFEHCIRLENVDIPVGNTSVEASAFSDCVSLRSVTIPQGVTSIGDHAFGDCYNLSSVTLPEGVTKIRDYAFSDCYDLTKIDIPDSVTSIGDYAFYCGSLQEIAIPDGVTRIGKYAFYFCDFSSVKLPSGITAIEEGTFWHCDSLTGVTIPANITSIGVKAFAYCDVLNSVAFEGAAPTIASNAFNSIKAHVCYPENEPSWTEEVRQNYGGTLTWINHSCEYISNGDVTCTEDGTMTGVCEYCGATVTTVDPSPGHQFQDNVCTVCGLEVPCYTTTQGILTFSIGNGVAVVTKCNGGEGELTVPAEVDGFPVTAIGANAFDHCASLNSITLPDSITSIADYAFWGCFGLNCVNIPEGVTHIGNYAFAECGLDAVEIPDTVKAIGDNAFRSCGDLASVTIPGSVASIGSNAFAYCGSLTEVTIQKGVTTIGEFAFAFCGNLTTVTVADSVTQVGDYAFMSSTNLLSISFLGDAPRIGNSTFANIPGTVYYHLGNDTWTDEVKQSYDGVPKWAGTHFYQDGTCTVCGIQEPVQPVMELQYPTLTFEDVVTMNVYYAADQLQDVVEMGLITYSAEVAEWNIDNAEVVIPGYLYNEGNALYITTTQGIAAKDMGSTYWFAVYAKLTDGSYVYTRLVSYSPIDYAYNQLEDEDPRMKQLVVAMLNYGAAAQTYFGCEPEELMNADLTGEQLASVESYRPDMITPVTAPSEAKAANFVRTDGFARRYPSITFEGAFQIDYFCVPSAVPVAGVTMYYWLQEDFDAVEVLSVDNATGAIAMDTQDGTYTTAIEGIAAKDLDKGVYVAFCYSDGTADYCSGILGYSIGTYCVSQIAANSDIAPFAEATAVYGYYAKQIFGN